MNLKTRLRDKVERYNGRSGVKARKSEKHNVDTKIKVVARPCKLRSFLSLEKSIKRARSNDIAFALSLFLFPLEKRKRRKRRPVSGASLFVSRWLIEGSTARFSDEVAGKSGTWRVKYGKRATWQPPREVQFPSLFPPFPLPFRFTRAATPQSAFPDLMADIPRVTRLASCNARSSSADHRSITVSRSSIGRIDSVTRAPKKCDWPSPFSLLLSTFLWRNAVSPLKTASTRYLCVRVNVRWS